NTRILGVERMSACFSSGLDPVTRHGYRNGLVGISMKVPHRSFYGRGAIVFRDTSTADRRCREKLWTARDHIPCACAAHGLTYNINAFVINGEVATYGIDDCKGHLHALSGSGDHLESAFFQLCWIVAHPSSVTLWCEYIARKVFLVLRK